MGNDSRSRRSLPPRTAKRKPDNDVKGPPPKKKRKARVETDSEESSDEDSVNLSYRWIDAGEPQPNGVTDHKLLEMVVEGKTSIVSVGDHMLLRSSDETPQSYNAKDSGDEEEAFVARIERMWEVPVGRKKQLREHCMKIRARWFFKKQDVETLSSNNLGPMSRQTLLRNMTNRDVILSNQTDDNDVLTLLAKCNVVMRKPVTAGTDPMPPRMPPKTFVSRYSIDFDNSGSAVLSAYDGENQQWPAPRKDKKEKPRAEPVVDVAAPLEDIEDLSDDEDEDEDDEIQKEESERKDEVQIKEKEPIDEPIQIPDEDAEKQPEEKRAEPLQVEDIVEKPSEEDVKMEEVSEPESPRKEPESDPVPKPVEEKKKEDPPASLKLEQPSKTTEESLLPKPKEEPGFKIAEEKIPLKREDTDDLDSTTTSESDANERDDHSTEVGANKGKIHVGPDHQVPVKPFRGKQRIVSRKPKLVWRKNQVSDSSMQLYLDRAGRILGAYAKLNNLLVEEPYMPLPFERTEVTFGEEEVKKMTLASVSTGSTVTEKKNPLTRECKIDALLETLNDEKGNADKAIKKVKAAPRDYLTAWTKTEKKLFDSGFRKYAGSLRMISKGVTMAKGFKDVVDFHYRFKIPDQFRRYQAKKLDCAVRMMNFLERRRCDDASISFRRIDDQKKVSKTQGVATSKAREWAKTAVAEKAVNMEDRRLAAKQLLLQIQKVMGQDAMSKIADAAKNIDGDSIADLKDKAVAILKDQPDLLEKFMEFLPKRFRTSSLA